MLRPHERIIYPPVDTDFYHPAAAAREDYYLCVSALVAYKRIDLAIEACKRLGRRLVVIGQGPERRRLECLAGQRGSVTLAGWCSNEAIRQHLQRARALLFPAHEDFGIVPLEAQACGTPVIAYGQGGATETVLPADEGKPGTGILFPSQTVGDWSRRSASWRRTGTGLTRRWPGVRPSSSLRPVLKGS